MRRIACAFLLGCLAVGPASWSQGLTEGSVKTQDGVELYYAKQGNGREAVILPGRLFVFDDLRWLADRYMLIAYDMRNRGRSSRVEDVRKITIEADVADLETVRRHFGVEKFQAIGYSYLGLMVVLYALDHPERVDRIVQLGPAQLKYGTEYEPQYVANDRQQVIEQNGGARLRELRAQNYHTSKPKEYCEEEWQVVRYMLVGDPSQVARMGSSVCEMPNEWPTNLVRHFEHHFAGSVQKLDVPRERVTALKTPVLTIHGTRDRNAPYAGGREWSYLLPNGRLLTIEGAAHGAFAEHPDVVRPAIAAFLGGNWPDGAVKITDDPRK